jgi:hypothetical protein
MPKQNRCTLPALCVRGRLVTTRVLPPVRCASHRKRLRGRQSSIRDDQRHMQIDRRMCDHGQTIRATVRGQSRVGKSFKRSTL